MRFRIFWVFLCSVLTGFAQNPPPRPLGGAVVSFYAEGSPAAYAGLSFAEAGKARPVPLQLGKRGPSIRYMGPRELILFVEVTANNTVKRVEKARVTLPEKAGIVMVLLSEKADQIRASALNLSPEVYPARSFLVLNNCPIPIALKISGQQGVSEPGKPLLIGPFPANLSSAELDGALQVEGKWQRTFSKSYTLPEFGRHILVLSPPKEGLVPEVKVFSDALPPPPKAPGARP